MGQQFDPFFDLASLEYNDPSFAKTIFKSKEILDFDCTNQYSNLKNPYNIHIMQSQRLDLQFHNFVFVGFPI